MKEFGYGFFGMLIAGIAILYAIDRYLRKPPMRYHAR